MRPAANMVLALTIFINPIQPYHVENGECPTVDVGSGHKDINRMFFHLKTWYIYAHTDPHPKYMSMFHLPVGLAPMSQCFRLFSKTFRGIIELHYNCIKHANIYQMTLYRDARESDSYQQMHSFKILYSVYRRFTGVQVIGTDGDSYVVFYGCQKVHNRALIGLMFLVRTDVYERFTPPPDLMRSLLKMSLNVTLYPKRSEEGCDCKGVIDRTFKKINEAYFKVEATKKARKRIKEQFGVGIRNFFICVFSFAMSLLYVNKLIDKYVFDLGY